MAKIYPKLGGLLLNDASWDAENVVVGVPYSKYLASVLRPGLNGGQTDPPPTLPPKVSQGGGSGGGGGSKGTEINIGPEVTDRPYRYTGPVLIFNGKFISTICHSQLSVLRRVAGLIIAAPPPPPPHVPDHEL